MQSVCLNWHILKANKRLSNRYDHKTLNKITRNLELFINDHCKGECKHLAEIIEKTRDPSYIIYYPK